MNKKTKIAIIGIIALVLVTIGITYAYWLITRTQEGENVITAGCLDITLDGENDITLADQFPLSDEDGAKLTPYTFTVTNNCNTSVDYQVALEATGDESTAIASSALKVAINDKTKLYSAYSEVDVTVSGAYESRKMLVDTLAPKDTEGSTATHELRIWVDKDADISEMNKTFKSKITVTVGQGIKKGIEGPYEEGTLAYSVLYNFDTSTRQEVEGGYEYENLATVSFDIDDKFYIGSAYEYDETTKKFKLSGEITEDNFSYCAGGWDEGSCIGYYYIPGSSSETDTSNVIYKIKSVTGENASFDIITFEEYSPFIREAADDLGNSYYYHGNVTNNYVKFGKWANDSTFTTCEEYSSSGSDGSCLSTKNVDISANSDMYWRIVRINGDGTIRLVYDGIEAVDNNTNHVAHIGINDHYGESYGTTISYTYDNGSGTQVDSAIKDVVDAWYESNLKTNYEKYIADGIFCNDKSKITVDGTEYYSGYYRLFETNNPQLTCNESLDRYTVNTTLGNGYLSNPVSLITADELALAGGEGKSYFDRGDGIITNTPYGSSAPGMPEYFMIVTYYDSSTSFRIGENAGYWHTTVRPVINLKADVQFTGNGTVDSPYEIVMN